MLSKFPCPEFLRDCECLPFPVRNFSQESADLPVFFGQFDQPPTNGSFFSPACNGFCESLVSQEEADLCAQRAAVECSLTGGGVGAKLNTFQSCTVECPDQTTFSWSVFGGVVASAHQSDANARAHGLACKRATQHRICFITDATLDSACINVATTRVFDVFGGIEPFVYVKTGGTLPTGMNFDDNGTLFGTPTVAGIYTFTVTVTDGIGSTQVKSFTLHVISITSPATLPGGTIGLAYSYTLLQTGALTPLWTFASGALPDGLTLNSLTGVISGTPTVGSTSTFTLELFDATGSSCSKQFTITVAGSLLSYWKFESFSGNLILDATPHGFNLTGDATTQLIVAGKVGNGVRMTDTDNLSLFAGPFALFNNVALTGFTLCGWFKLAAPDNTGDGNIVNVVQWTGSNFSLEILNADLLLNINAEDFSAPVLTIANPQDGGWHFYRIWFDPADSKMRFQLDNGAIVVSPAIPFGSGAFSQFVLASNSVFAGGTFRFLDETGFWKRVLSNTEASQLWNSGNGTTYPTVPS